VKAGASGVALGDVLSAAAAAGTLAEEAGVAVEVGSGAAALAGGAVEAPGG
jgi:hypothetical protein